MSDNKSNYPNQKLVAFIVVLILVLLSQAIVFFQQRLTLKEITKFQSLKAKAKKLFILDLKKKKKIKPKYRLELLRITLRGSATLQHESVIPGSSYSYFPFLKNSTAILSKLFPSTFIAVEKGDRCNN